MSLHVGKIFYVKSSELPKIDANLFSIMSLESTVQYIHLKSALVALMFFTQHNVRNMKGRLGYDTFQQISRDLEQICKLLTNNFVINQLDAKKLLL